MSNPENNAKHMIPNTEKPLRICLLSYRSNPHCGGQGGYVRNLSRALTSLGHRVDVLSGQPYPELSDGVNLIKIPSLDLYNADNLFRIPTAAELSDMTNLVEWLGTSTMGFPEPYTFGLRSWQYLKKRLDRYDIIHDNQSLSYGLWAVKRKIPTIATIHHPITVDCDIAVKTEAAFWRKLKHLRWYSFLDMQKRVSRTIPHFITVSSCARKDICREFKLPENRFSIIPNGISTDLFYPFPGIEREKNRIMVTNSADTPLKGLHYLLFAIAEIAKTRDIHLVVIGKPKKNSIVARRIRSLGIGHLITFTGRISHEEFVRQYARATMAVVPSIYEGFGLPAGEAMACGVPLISTTGGALPEVVGDAGLLVPPADAPALKESIEKLLDDPDLADELGRAGYERVQKHLTWNAAAQNTVAAYRKVIRDYH